MRNRHRQTITIIILLFVIAGISIGFAAFSNTLSINSSAHVIPNASDFSIVFANNYNLNDLDVGSVNPSNLSTGTGSNGTINNSAQGGPQLTGLSASFTQPGQTVIYDLYIVNNGHFDAYLTDLVFNNVAGAASPKTCNRVTEGYNESQWATSENLNTICDNISVSIELDGNQYDSTSDLENLLIEKGSYKSLKVIVNYSGSTYANGPMVIRLGSISITASTIGSQVIPIVEGNAWVERGLTSTDLEYNKTYYNSLGIQMMINSNGGFYQNFLGTIDPEDFDDAIENNLAVVYTDGFAFIIDDEINLVLVTGPGVITIYACDESVGFDKQSIITAATAEEEVFEFYSNVWVARGLTSSDVIYDEPYYNFAQESEFEFYSDGGLLIDEANFTSSDVDDLIENDLAAIYTDGFAIVNEEEEQIGLFVFTTGGTATFYVCSSDVGLDKEEIIETAMEQLTVFDFEVSTIWETRGITSPYLAVAEIYNGLPGPIAFFPNGSFQLTDIELSSSDFDDAIENELIYMYSDGFAMSIEEEGVIILFVLTDDGEAMLYVTEDTSVGLNRQAIITAATEEESVFEYSVSSGTTSWPDRGLESEYVQYDVTYTTEFGEEYFVRLNSDGSLIFFGGTLYSTYVDAYISNHLMYVYPDGFALCPDEENYYLFVYTGEGTATLYVSNSLVAGDFNRENIISHATLTLPYIAEPN